jgi:hypothetical protein
MAPPKGKNPNKWKYKDPDVHKKHIPFLRARAQAVFRGESWNLSFEEFQEIWTEDLWNQRGRLKDCLIMRLTNSCDLDWRKDNVEIVVRKDHLSRKRTLERGRPRKPRQKETL